MSQNDGKEPPIYVETLHNHRHHDYTATNGDAIHRFPVRLAEIWNQYDQIPDVPDPSLLLDGDVSGVTQLAKNRALALVSGTTHKFELATIPTDLALVITATQGQTAPIAGNLAPTLAAAPQPATGYTPVIQDSTGAVFEMQASVWVVDGLNHIVEFPYGVPPEMIPPFALTYVRYTGSTGGSSSAPVLASWAYVADTSGTSFVADSTFPGATVSDWLVGEAAAAIAQSTEGAGTRIMFDVSKGAFRAGTVTGTQWNDANRGVGSAAFGTDNVAATANSLVAGGSGLTLTDQDSTLYTQRLRLAGGLQVPVNVVATDTLATIDDYAFSVDSTGGPVAVTLPAAPVAGQFYKVKHLLGANLVTVSGNGNNVDQGDGTTGASATLPDAGDSATYLWDDTTAVWLVVDVAGASAANTYVADVTGTSFVADASFPGAVVSDWLVGEAAAAIAQSTEGAGSRTMFDVSKGAFRAGTVTGAQWNDANRGVGSAAFGTDNTAATANSLVAGGSGLTLTDQDSTLYTQRLRQAGGLQVPVNVVTGSVLATIDDYAFSADTTGGVVTITLPAAPVAGQLYKIKHLVGGNAVVVGGNGNNVDQGDGTTGASATLSSAGDSATFTWDDASGVWLVLGTGNSAVTPWTYVADATGTSFVADATFSGAVVSDWLVGEAAAAIAQSTEGAGSRVMFDVSKGAFRAGTVTGAQWNDVSRGVGSAAFGTDNVAATANSLVAGGAGLTLADQDSTLYTQRLRQAGGLQIPVNVVAADTLATIDDYAFSVDTTGGAVAVTLPASPVPGQLYRVKYLLGGNSVTVSGNGNSVDQGNGTTAANLTLANPGDTVTVVWDDATGVWLAMDVATGGGSAPVTPVPAVLDLNVSAAGDDATGDGTVGSPYLTIQRALEDAQTLGWDDEASVTILAAGGNFVLPTGEVSFNAGTRGAQRTPLKIRGSARSVLATGTVDSAPAPLALDEQLYISVATARNFVSSDVADVVVRFTSGPLSAYSLSAAYPATTEVSAFLSERFSATVVALAFNGGGTDPLPNVGDSVSIERFATTVEITGPLRIRSDANAVTFEDLNIVAHEVGGSAAFFADSTAIATNGVRFVPDAGVALSLSNPGAEWYAGGNEAALSAGFVASTLGVAIDLSAAGSSVITETPGISLTNAAKHWSNVVVEKAPAQLADPFRMSGSLREYSWQDQTIEVAEGDRLVMRNGRLLGGPTDAIRVFGALDIEDCVAGSSTNAIGVYRGGALLAGTMTTFRSVTRVLEIDQGSSATVDLGELATALGGNAATSLARVREVSSLTDSSAASTIGSPFTLAFEIDSGSTLTATSLTITNTSSFGVIVVDGAVLAVDSLTVQGSATGINVSRNGRLASNGNVTVTGATTATMTVSISSSVAISGTLSLTSSGGNGCTVAGASSVSVTGDLNATAATGNGLTVQDASRVNVDGQVNAGGNSVIGVDVLSGSTVTVGGDLTVAASGSIGAQVAGAELRVEGNLTALGTGGDGISASGGAEVTVGGRLLANANTSGAAVRAVGSTISFTTAQATAHNLSGCVSGLVATTSQITVNGGLDCSGCTGDGVQLSDSSRLTIVPVLGALPLDVSGAGVAGLELRGASTLDIGSPNSADGAITATGCAGDNISVVEGSSVQVAFNDADSPSAILASGAGNRGIRCAGGSSMQLGECTVDASGANSTCCLVDGSVLQTLSNLTCDGSVAGGNLNVLLGATLSAASISAQNAATASVSVSDSLFMCTNLDCSGAAAAGAQFSAGSIVRIRGTLTGSTALQPSGSGVLVFSTSNLWVVGNILVDGAASVGLSVSRSSVVCETGVSSVGSATGLVVDGSQVTVAGAAVATGSVGNNLEISGSSRVFLGSATLSGSTAGGGGRVEGSTLEVGGPLTASGNATLGVEIVSSAVTVAGAVTANGNAGHGVLAEKSVARFGGGAAEHLLDGNGGDGLSAVASHVVLGARLTCSNSGGAGVSIASGSRLDVVGDGVTPGAAIAVDTSGSFGVLVDAGSALTLRGMPAAALEVSSATGDCVNVRGGSAVSVDSGAVDFQGGLADGLVVGQGSQFAAAASDLTDLGSAGTTLVVDDGSQAQLANVATAGTVRGCFVNASSSLVTMNLTVDSSGGEGCRVSRLSRLQCDDFAGSSTGGNSLIVFQDSGAAILGTYTATSSGNNALNVLRNSSVSVHGAFVGTQATADAINVTENSTAFIRSAADVSNAGGNGVCVEGAVLRFDSDVTASSAASAGMLATGASTVTVGGALTATAAGTSGMTASGASQVTIVGAVDVSGANASCLVADGAAVRCIGALLASSSTTGNGVEITGGSTVFVGGTLTSATSALAGVSCVASDLRTARLLCSDNQAAGVELIRSSATLDAGNVHHVCANNIIDNFVVDESAVVAAGGLDVDGAATTGNALTVARGSTLTLESGDAATPVLAEAVGGYALHVSGASTFNVTGVTASVAISANDSLEGVLIDGKSTVAVSGTSGSLEVRRVAGTALTITGSTLTVPAGAVNANLCTGPAAVVVSGGSFISAVGLNAANSENIGIRIRDRSDVVLSGDLNVSIPTLGRGRTLEIFDSSKVQVSGNATLSSTLNNSGGDRPCLFVKENSSLRVAGILDSRTLSHPAVRVDTSSSVSASSMYIIGRGAAHVSNDSRLFSEAGIVGDSNLASILIATNRSHISARGFFGLSPSDFWGIQLESGSVLERRAPGSVTDNMTGDLGDVSLGGSVRTWAALATTNPNSLTDFTAGELTSQMCTVIYTPDPP